jgi:hypothetical protein
MTPHLVLNGRFRHNSRQLLFLAFCLGVISLSCFMATLHLLTIPHRTKVLNFAELKNMDTLLNDTPVKIQVHKSLKKTTGRNLSSDDRYLSYMPHSGFHNQRIALENALVLSRILGRTLIIPPVRLGRSPIHYADSDKLRYLLVLSGKEGLRHCASTTGLRSLDPPECEGVSNFTHVRWDWLIDFTSLVPEYQLYFHSDLSYFWLDGSVTFLADDIMEIKDKHLYDFRYVDRVPEDIPRVSQKYMHPVPISRLSKMRARHMCFGSLFGSSRLHLEDPAHIAIRTQVREQMVLANPGLLAAASSAQRGLGETYAGAHIRIGDGHFRRKSRENVRLIWYKLITRLLALSYEEALKIELRIISPDTITDPPDFDAEEEQLQTLLSPLRPSFSPKLHCQRRLYKDPVLQNLNIPLFISTDAVSPRNHPLFTPLLRTFPCLFFLSDLGSSSVSSPSGKDNIDLSRLVSAYDGLQLLPLLHPLLDAVIVAHAWTVAGTPGSTFSAYVEDVLWRHYHDLPIVQHGK